MFAMTMTLTHLGTGSRGNATLLETETSKVLIDQGFSGAQLEKRLARMNIHPTEIDFIFISHHHGDHGGGALVAQKKWGLRLVKWWLKILRSVLKLTKIQVKPS